MRATTRFRELLRSSTTIRSLGAHDVFTARLIEAAGLETVFLGGFGASASMLGLPDVGFITLTEMADAVRRMAQRVQIPVVADGDTGHGDLHNVTRTVREFEAAGAAGVLLEDQVTPKRCGHFQGKQIIPAEEMVLKYKAAIAARRDPDFVIIARTDARGVTNFADAVSRAKLYLAAGADAIFPEALENEGEFKAFAQAVPAPLLANMTEFGKSTLLDQAQLAALGYKLVLYPVTAFRSALRAAADTLQDIRSKGHQRERVASMLTRQELYDLLGYTGYEERDRSYFG